MLHGRLMRAARSLALLCLALFAAAPAGADQITDSARTIWRDYTVDGVPTSGAWNPRKGDIRTFGALVGSSITALQAAQTGAALAFDTKANLDASLAYAANTQAFVYADSTPDNNGIYRKNGASGAGSWTKVSALVYGPTPTFGLGTVTVTACNTSPAAALGGTALAPVLNLSFPSCNYDGAIPLPTPTTTARGGVIATPTVTHQFVTGLDTATGDLVRAQPVAGDLGDIAADTYLGNAGAAPAAPAAVSRSNCNGATKALNYTSGSGESCNSAIHAATSDTVTTNANLTGDVTSVGNATTIAANAVTNAKAAQMPAESFKCNNTGGAANSIDCTASQATALLNPFTGDSGSGGVKGLVPAPASGDAAAGKVLGAGGSWVAQASTGVIVRPETYGVTWDGVTDDTAAWQALATALNASGGGAIVVCPAGQTSMIWKNSSGVPTGALISLTVPGVTFFWNGSRLTTDQANFSAAQLNAVFLLNTGVVGFESHDLVYTQTASLTLDSTIGGRLFYINNAAREIRLFHSEQTGGRSFVEIAAGTWQTQNPRAELISIIGAELNTVYYVLNGQGNGDKVFARGLKCNNVGRCVFPWNVSQWDVEAASNHGGPFNDVLVKTYADSTADVVRNKTSDIRIRYRNVGRQNATASQSLVAIEFQQNTGTASAGFMNNIHIDIDAADNNGNGQPIGVATWKFDSAGNPENTVRGYILDNLVISGNFYYSNNAAIDLFNTTNGSFAGETMRNIILRDVVVDGSSIPVAIDAGGISNNLVLNNVHVHGSNNINMSGCCATQTLILNNVQSANLTDAGPITSVFTSGTDQTYTTPIGAAYLDLELVGGGGGGSGSGTSPGAVTGGGSTCWNNSGTACSSAVYASTGGGNGVSGAPGAGGGAGAIVGSCNDAFGAQAGQSSSGATGNPGGHGGGNAYGPGGAGGNIGNASGGPFAGQQAPSYGGGGGGASMNTTANGGSGGGGSPVCRVRIVAPAASYVYTVGGAGSGGSAGTGGAAGGQGGAGRLKVTAHFH